MCSLSKINNSFTKHSDELFANLYRTHSGIDRMFDTILNILGIEDLSVIRSTNLLIHVGMDFKKQYLLKKKLEEDFGVELMDSDLAMMSIGKLYDLIVEVRQFQNQLIRNNKASDNLLFNFKLFIGSAEDRIRLEYCTTIMYEMSVRRESSHLNRGVCAILLPGLDNNVSSFVDMAHSISFSTFIVKYGNNETFVGAITNEILKDIKRLCQDKHTFQLVGYSFGSLIAIELARILESLNKNVKIICIDGSPLLFQLSLDHLTCAIDGQNSSDLELATYIAHSFHSTRLPSLFRNELNSLKSWNVKVQWLTDIARKLYLNIPEENFQSICKGVFNRTYAAAAYVFDSNRSIDSPITLIKSDDEIVSHTNYDYGLKLCSKNCVDVHNFYGNHYTILENCDIVTVINEVKY